jgi:hypothetical protein
MKIRVLLAAAAAVLAAGCTPAPSAASRDDAQAVADNMTYVKDGRTGLCFGIIMRVSKTTYGSDSMSATLVPCDKVESLIVN